MSRIRRLVVADLAALRALRHAALAREPTAFGASPEEDAALSDAAMAARLADPNAVLGAFAGEDLVGMAGFAPESGAKRRHRAMLWGVFVRLEHRGAGLGRALVAAVIARARGRVVVLEASVGAANAGARALYASLGFAPYGLHRRALKVGDEFHDEILIALDLDGEAAEGR